MYENIHLFIILSVRLIGALIFNKLIWLSYKRLNTLVFLCSLLSRDFYLIVFNKLTFNEVWVYGTFYKLHVRPK